MSDEGVSVVIKVRVCGEWGASKVRGGECVWYVMKGSRCREKGESVCGDRGECVW